MVQRTRTRTRPFLYDVFRQWFWAPKDEVLPTTIAELLDPAVCSRMVGYAVDSVVYADVQLEQHANCTDRAWLVITPAPAYDSSDNIVQAPKVKVFAKVAAKNLVVKTLMSMFDVYRNEIHSYASIDWPIRIPDVHCAKWSQSRFCLILEDLSDRGASFPNIWEQHVTPPLAKQVLSTLATLHASKWGAEGVPDGCWDAGNRPYKARSMGMFTLWRVNRLYPDLIPQALSEALMVALWRWNDLQRYWETTNPRCMVHGDTHMGNFFIEPDQTIGTFDLQVKSEEHPMRDVAYFLACSYPEEDLPKHEKMLIKYYIARLKASGAVPDAELPTFEECWFQYRLHTWYALYAFVFSGGFADGVLMDEVQTKVACKRIVALMERVDARGTTLGSDES